ncbi:MAG: hypothetical protein HZA94_00675 [Candidatus Vogelbacteria bacterium]|nr:hypothetical protein [Candidatus Vogelbacteria bacterium]
MVVEDDGSVTVYHSSGIIKIEVEIVGAEVDMSLQDYAEEFSEDYHPEDSARFVDWLREAIRCKPELGLWGTSLNDDLDPWG